MNPEALFLADSVSAWSSSDRVTGLHLLLGGWVHGYPCSGAVEAER